MNYLQITFFWALGLFLVMQIWKGRLDILEVMCIVTAVLTGMKMLNIPIPMPTVTHALQLLT